MTERDWSWVTCMSNDIDDPARIAPVISLVMMGNTGKSDYLSAVNQSRLRNLLVSQQFVEEPDQRLKHVRYLAPTSSGTLNLIPGRKLDSRNDTSA